MKEIKTVEVYYNNPAEIVRKYYKGSDADEIIDYYKEAEVSDQAWLVLNGETVVEFDQHDGHVFCDYTMEDYLLEVVDQYYL